MKYPSAKEKEQMRTVRIQMVGLKLLTLLSLAFFGWIGFNGGFNPENIRAKMRAISEHEECLRYFFLQKEEERNTELQEEAQAELIEQIKKHENHLLQSGLVPVSKIRTDKLSRKRVQEVGYGITTAEIAEAKRFGFLPANAKLPTSLSKAEADEWFVRVTMPTYTRCVESVCKMEVTSEQKLALISFCHNLGTSNLKRLLRHKPSEIGIEMRKYCHANGKKLGGLEKRREWEAQMWEGGLKKSAILASR